MHEHQSWDESHFNEMSWHDNHVHGLRIREGLHGCGELELDLDYILEWLCPAPSSVTFRVAPATLTFLDVFNLRIEIDYASATAGITPFSIGAIKREEGESGMPPNWTIELNWPNGAITFSARRFKQTLRAAPIVSESQGLDAQQRTPLGG